MTHMDVRNGDLVGNIDRPHHRIGADVDREDRCELFESLECPLLSMSDVRAEVMS
jgi:hypothetical protein